MAMRRRNATTSLFEMLKAARRAAAPGSAPASATDEAHPVEESGDATHFDAPATASASRNAPVDRAAADDLVPPRVLRSAVRSTSPPWAPADEVAEGEPARGVRHESRPSARGATAIELQRGGGSPASASRSIAKPWDSRGPAPAGAGAAGWTARLPGLPSILSSWGSGGGDAPASLWSWLNYPESMRRVTLIVIGSVIVLACALSFQAGRWASFESELPPDDIVTLHPQPRGSFLPEMLANGKESVRNVEPTESPADDVAAPATTSKVDGEGPARHWTVLVATTKASAKSGAQRLMLYLDKYPDLGHKAECIATDPADGPLLLQVVIGRFATLAEAEVMRRKVGRLRDYEGTDFGDAVVRELTFRR